MAGLSFGRKVVAAQPPATHEVRAESRSGKWMLTSIGSLGYLVLGILVVFAIGGIAEAAGVTMPTAVVPAVGLAIPAIAAWRGATVSAAVRPTDVVVRNRWRTEVVLVGEIEAVEAGTSAPYILLTSAMMLRDLFTMSDDDMTEEGDEALPNLLKIRRRGRRWRLPVYATFAMSADPAAMQPFLDALAAIGHEVVDERPTPTT